MDSSNVNRNSSKVPKYFCNNAGPSKPAAKVLANTGAKPKVKELKMTAGPAAKSLGDAQMDIDARSVEKPTTTQPTKTDGKKAAAADPKQGSKIANKAIVRKQITKTAKGVIQTETKEEQELEKGTKVDPIEKPLVTQAAAEVNLVAKSDIKPLKGKAALQIKTPAKTEVKEDLKVETKGKNDKMIRIADKPNTALSKDGGDAEAKVEAVIGRKLEKGALSTTHTKITLHRMATTLCSNRTPRTETKMSPPLHNALKLNLPAREMASKAITAKDSKLSVRSTVPKASQKSLTARTPPSAVTQRSASTISYRSLRAPKKTDSGLSARWNRGGVNAAGDTTEVHNMTARERVAENNKLRVFESMQRKVQDMQSDFMQKFETLKLSSPDKLKCSYKFIAMVKGTECKLLVKDDDLLRLPRKLPADSVGDFREKVKDAMDSCLEALVSRLRKVQSMTNEYERKLNLEDIHNELSLEQGRRLSELQNTIDMLTSGNTEFIESNTAKLQNQLNEAKSTKETLEKKLGELRDNIADLHRQQQEDKERYNKDMRKKDVEIADLQSKHRASCQTMEEMRAVYEVGGKTVTTITNERDALSDKLEACNEVKKTLTEKLCTVEAQLSEEKDATGELRDELFKLQEKLENARKICEELKNESNNDEEVIRLKTILKETEKDQLSLQRQLAIMKLDKGNECENTCGPQLQAMQAEIARLKSSLEAAEKEKLNLHMQLVEIKQEKRNECKADYSQRMGHSQVRLTKLEVLLEETRKSNSSLQNQLREAQQECSKIDSLREQLKIAEGRVQQLMACRNGKQNAATTALNEKLETEIKRLRQSESANQKCIAQSRSELQQSRARVTELEEQLRRDYEMLGLRTEVIQSMQQSEVSQRNTVADMFAKLGENNATIEELKAELIMKSEEFSHLFATLGEKQVQIKHQEHMTKMLEESNERNQRIRVKQEEKVGQLEVEILKLRRKLGFYENSPTSSSAVKNCHYPQLAEGETSDYQHSHSDDRRGKRKVDISVKTYDA